MSAIAAAVKHMLAAGMAADAIVAAVEEMEATSPQAQVMDAADRKRERDRDRIAAKRAAAKESRDIERQSPESRDMSDSRATSATPRALSCAQVVIPSLPSEEVITPSTDTSCPSPKSKPPARKASSPRLKSSRCPLAWTPSDEDWSFGAGEGFVPGEIERELAKFRDHEFAKPRSDWSATFRNWLRKASDDRNHRSRNRPDPIAARAARRGVWAEIAAEERRKGAGGSG